MDPTTSHPGELVTHEIIKCREHGTSYAQCRCPSPDKQVVFVDCNPELCADRVPAAERDRNALKERIARAWLSTPDFDGTNFGACAENVLKLLESEGWHGTP
jgi:hypothetical protein